MNAGRRELLSANCDARLRHCALFVVLALSMVSRAKAACVASFTSDEPTNTGVVWHTHLERPLDQVAGMWLEVRRNPDEDIWDQVPNAFTVCSIGSSCNGHYPLTACYLPGREFRLRPDGSACTSGPNGPVNRTFSLSRGAEAVALDGGRMTFKTFHSQSGTYGAVYLPSGAPASGGAFPSSITTVVSTGDGGVTQSVSLLAFAAPAPAGTIGILGRVRSCDLSDEDAAVDLFDRPERGSCNEAGSCCSTCVGDPVRVSNGNLHYVEQDPLPGNAAFHLARIYESNYDDGDPYDGGVFGPGWSSAFDARIILGGEGGPDDDAEQVVSLRTEGNEWVVYWRKRFTGSYKQVWPRIQAENASLVRNGDVFIYRSPTDRLERWFSAITGRLVAIRSFDGTAGITITWSGAVPVRVDSLNGEWALVVSSGGGRVNSIQVEGLSALTWHYVYNELGELTAVSDANDLPWRTYEYADHPSTTFADHDLVAIHDATGALLESHAYSSGGAASTSSGPSGEITSIRRNDSFTPRVPSEEAVITIWANGRNTTHYTRLVGGRRRTVQVAGCTECGENRVYVYDNRGNVIREQDGRGYISVRNYAAGTSRLTSSGSSYRPSGCDPETDPSHCLLTPDLLKTTTLLSTAATVVRDFEYADANWPDRPTLIGINSVLHEGGRRVETFVYDAQTGETLEHATSGYTGADIHLETHTTTTSLYNGSEGAAFVPGGAFEAAWLSLPQPQGRRKRLDGPLPNVNDDVTWVYYPVNAAVPAANRGRLAAQRNALGHITRYEDYDPFGNARRIVDPNGVTHESSYDSQGRLLTSTVKGVSGCNTSVDPLCATDLTRTRTYTPSPGPLASEQRQGGGVTAYTYDARGRTETLSRGPSTSALRERIEYEYDPATGFKVGERILAWESASWVERKSTRYEYDVEGRLFRTFHPPYQPSPLDGDYEETTYGPDGIVAAIKDARHMAPNTQYVYDSAGRLTEVRQLADAAGVGTWITTRYLYDLHGNLVSVVDPNGNETTYVDDDFGRMILQASPVTGTTSYEYDAADRLVTTIDANHAGTTRTYDVLGRVLAANSTREWDPLNDSLDETVTWTYDIGLWGVGRLSSMTDPTGSTSYTYDRRGLLLTQVTSLAASEIAPKQYTTGFRYDADGNRSAVTYPSSAQATYAYDYAGRPLTLTMDGVTLVSAATYLPFGPRVALSYGNGTVQTQQYDQRYQMDTNALNGASGTIASYDYAHDANGNITAIADLVNDGYNRTFGYDDLGRMTAANTGSALWGTGSYAYDAMGNLLSSTLGSNETAFAYEEPTPKLTTVTTSAETIDVTYDFAGNETPKGTKISPRNHLVAYDGPVMRMDYGYDGRGVRTKRTEHDNTVPDLWTTSHTTYTPELEVLSTKSYSASFRGPETTTDQREIVWFGGTPVAQLDGLTALRALRYTFSDHLGTPLLQTNTAGEVVWRAEYDPYGTLVEQRAGTADEQPLRFPGQEAEAGSDLYQNVFRWYRAGWGRYTQADPFVSARLGELNLYLYSQGNPLRLTDPSGLFKVDSSCRDCYFGGKDGKDVDRGVDSVCNKYLKNPSCAKYIENLVFTTPRDKNGAEPLGSCLRRRCQGDSPIFCAKNVDPDPIGRTACGAAPTLTSAPVRLMRGEYTGGGLEGGRCSYDMGSGWGPAIFHEAVHTCGMDQESYPDPRSSRTSPYSALFSQIMQRCAGVP
jgi:RHS repeat-associated protein